MLANPPPPSLLTVFFCFDQTAPNAVYLRQNTDNLSSLHSHSQLVYSIIFLSLSLTQPQSLSLSLTLSLHLSLSPTHTRTHTYTDCGECNLGSLSVLAGD